jgi:hypothetical protein
LNIQAAKKAMPGVVVAHLHFQDNGVVNVDQNKDGLKSANPIAGLPGAVFEKAWELRWALKLTYVCLFLDSLCAFALHQNLMGFSGNMAMLWERLGTVFVGVTSFCLIVSLVIPAIARFACIAGIYLPWQWFEGHVRYDMLHGYVTHGALREHSIRKDDEFAWKRWESAESMRNEARANRYQAGELIFGLGVFGVFNAWVGISNDVETLMLALNAIIGFSGWFLVSTVMVAGLYWAWWATEEVPQIYHPTLYEELRAKEPPLFRAKAKHLGDQGSDD